MAPGARLHVLSVGVSKYGDKASHLRLDYAAKDAQDVISALINTQSGLYADVSSQELKDTSAIRIGVFQALDTMTANLQRGAGRDVAVLMFSGHGALIEGEYYLLPHDVAARTPEAITTSAIEVSTLRKRLAKLGESGRVLVLLDACRSGAATASGSALAGDGGLLRTALMGLANVTVLTSSNSNQLSYESKEWENGAFTKVLLRAFGKDADADRNGLVSTTELTSYLSDQLPRLTQNKGRQEPAMEIRFQSELFVSGLWLEKSQAERVDGLDFDNGPGNAQGRATCRSRGSTLPQL